MATSFRLLAAYLENAPTERTVQDIFIGKDDLFLQTDAALARCATKKIAWLRPFARCQHCGITQAS